jgi:hypothetical protein
MSGWQWSCRSHLYLPSVKYVTYLSISVHLSWPFLYLARPTHFVLCHRCEWHLQFHVTVLSFGWHWQVMPQAICSRFGLAVGANLVWLVKILMWICFPVAYPVGLVISFLWIYLIKVAFHHMNGEILKESHFYRALCWSILGSHSRLSQKFVIFCLFWSLISGQVCNDGKWVADSGLFTRSWWFSTIQALTAEGACLHSW